MNYADLEDSILASLLVCPEYMESLIVEERHFKKFGYILTFFKEFYSQYKNLDLNLMWSVVKGDSQEKLLEAIEYLVGVFAMPTHCLDYQKRLLKIYAKDKKEDWLRKKIYLKATSLYLGNSTLEEFNNEVNRLYKKAEEIEWR